jgi:hypothetical protein
MNRQLYFHEQIRRTADDIVATVTDPASRLFQTATDRAVARTDELHSRLHVNLGGFDVGRGVTIELGTPERRPDAVVIPIRWRATGHAALFPSMDAHLEVATIDSDLPLSQLSIIGSYRPPAGPAGAVGDRVLGHRLAEAAVRHFLTELAARLAPLPSPTASGAVV